MGKKKSPLRTSLSVLLLSFFPANGFAMTEIADNFLFLSFIADLSFSLSLTIFSSPPSSSAAISLISSSEDSFDDHCFAVTIWLFFMLLCFGFNGLLFKGFRVFCPNLNGSDQFGLVSSCYMDLGRLDPFSPIITSSWIYS